MHLKLDANRTARTEGAEQDQNRTSTDTEKYADRVEVLEPEPNPQT